MMPWLVWISESSGKKRLGPDAHDALALVTLGGSGKKRLGPDAHDALALVTSGGSEKKRLGSDADDALALVDFWELREETAGP